MANRELPYRNTPGTMDEGPRKEILVSLLPWAYKSCFRIAHDFP